MLTTLVGGDVFEFIDGQGQTVRIAVSGDTTAVVLGADVVIGGGGATLDDLPGIFVAGSRNGQAVRGGLGRGSTEDPLLADLYSIQVTEGHSDSAISVFVIDEEGVPQPFTGTVTVDLGEDVVIPENIGGVYVGARRAGDGEEEAGLSPVGQIGGTPAGVTVDAGQQADRILIGGALTGAADLQSIRLFYAGWLITGFGVDDFDEDNFSVNGDIRHLATAGPIGVDSTGAFSSGFSLGVVGKIGQVHSNGAFQGQIELENQAIDNTLTQEQEELEDRGLGGGIHFALGDAQFFNDSFDTAEALGTLRGDELGDPDFIHVVGSLNASPLVEDFVDYFSIPLLAGQTVTVKLTPGEDGILDLEDGTDFHTMKVGIFDPDGRLIATDYSLVDHSALNEVPIMFTADRPGEYRIAVAFIGDADFDGAAGGDEQISQIGRDYTLTVEGAGDLAIGGLRAGADVNASLAAERGDWGAVRATGVFAGSIEVVAGSLRSLVASEGVVSLEIPVGHVGLLKTTTGGLTMVTAEAIGGNFQLLDVFADLGGTIRANGGIGVLRAGSMSAEARATIVVNADLTGNDGIIDLFDIEGNLGSPVSGGPAITTGPGGNVRYMRVGGAVIADRIFNLGNDPPVITQPAGQSFEFHDDSGGTITLSPTSATGVVSVLIYGIRGSGGSVLITATSGTGMNVAGSGGTVEVSQIVTGGAGQPVVAGADGRLSLSSNAGDPLRVNITGPAPIEVFEIKGAAFTSITNSTRGEIVNIDADSIGTLTAGGTLGLATNHTGAAVNPRVVLSDNYPFVQQHIGIVSGHIIRASADRGVGNFIVTGTIGTLTANADGVDEPLLFEGIAAPIFATQDLQGVNIGEGLAETGNGLVARSGLYAQGQITSITNQGLGSDIRGNVVAEGGIGDIRLTNGAVIDAIIQASELDDSTEFISSFLATGEVGDLTLSGATGMLGARVVGISIGDVNVAGFGIINSQFQVGAAGSIGNVTAGGLGLRDVQFIGGANQGNITASGKGQVLTLASFTPSARFADATKATRLNDLPTYLEDQDLVAGVIFNVEARGSGNLGAVSGFRISDSEFRFANQIKSIASATTITDVLVITGKLTSFSSPGDVSDLDMTVAGEIGKVVIGGNLLGDSIINATGPNGSIGSILILGNASGSIFASGQVGTIDIRGNLDGNIVIGGLNASGVSLKSLKLGGSLVSGSLDVTGDVGSIETAGGLGVAGDQLLIKGSLKTLKVGTAKSPVLDGASLALSLIILGDLGSADINGRLEGDVTIKDELGTFKVTADPATAGSNIVAGNVLVGNSVKSFLVTGGDMGGDLTAGLNIGAFTLKGGDVLATSAIVSTFGGINKFAILGSDLFGDVEAEHGTVKSVQIQGNLGAEASLVALGMGTVSIGGSVLSGAVVEVTNLLTAIQIGQELAAGAAIRAGGTQKVKTGAAMLGELLIGRRSPKTSLEAGGDLAGDSQIDSDLQVKVGGDYRAGSQLLVNGNLTGMAVTGMWAGDAIVTGSAGKLSAMFMNGAVLTTGGNVASLALAGALGNSLIQIGISPGVDGIFATVPGNRDAGEVSGSSDLVKFSSASVTSSVIAAGGSVRSLTTGIMTDSSISAGLSLGSAAIAAALADGTRLVDVAELNAARSGADRTLLDGDIASAKVGSMSGSALTASVDAGEGGAFGDGDDSSLITSADGTLVGGAGAMGKIAANLNANSHVLAVGGITGNSITGTVANVDTAVTFPLAALTANSVLPAAVGTASSVAPFVYNTAGGTLTITVTGGGFVDVHDEPGGDTDNLVEALVLRGTNAKTAINVAISNPGLIAIERILAPGGLDVGSLTVNGDLVGDGSADPDLWIGGGAGTLALRTLGDNVQGWVGGDVKTLSLVTQGAGTLRIGGTLSSLGVGAGTGDAGDVGIVADTLTSVTVGEVHSGAISAGLGGVGKAVLGGPFAGALASAAGIVSLSTSALFSGAVTSLGNLGKATLQGEVGPAAVIDVGGALSNFTQTDANFAGVLRAQSAGKVVINANLTDTALIDIDQHVATLTLNNTVAGQVHAGSAGAVSAKALLLDTGRLTIDGDATKLTLTGGTQDGSLVIIGGAVNALAVGATHSGNLAVQLGVRTAKFATVDAGLFNAGLNTQSLTVSGNAANSVFALGTWVGDDGLFNTADDLITGGSVTRATFSGNFIDSVIAAGVLPRAGAGQFVPGVSDNRGFVGQAGGAVELIDPAEAGGLLTSRITKLVIKGAAISSSPNTGRLSAALAADALTNVAVGSLASNLNQRVLNDPFGAPVVVDSSRLSAREIRVIFSELITTDSLVLDTALNDGTVLVTDENDVPISGVTLSYTTRTADDGTEQGVLRVLRSTDFPGTVKVTLVGTSDLAVLDRSALRSALRDVNADGVTDDPFGTILDVDDDGTEGDGTQVITL